MTQAQPTHNNLYTALRSGFPTVSADHPEGLAGAAITTQDGLVYSWSDLERGSAMIANWLVSQGFQPGDRIAVQVEKSVEAVMLYLATLRSGMVFVPFNTAYQQGEMAYFLADAQPVLVVCSSAHFVWLSTLAFKANIPYVVTLNSDRTGTLLERAAWHSDQHDVVAREAGDLAAILYTSGTTGRSKGAMLSHGNLLSNAQVLQTYWDWQPDDVLLHVLPIFHVHGLFVALHGALINGSPIVWHDRFDVAEVIAALPNVTVMMGVPTMYVRLLAEPTWDRATVASIRLFISGSAPLLMDTFHQWQQRTGSTILERYGMTETAMLTSNPCLPDPRYQGRTERRGGTVGFPLPGVHLQILDNQGVALGVGEIGNIVVKGPNVFAGYWRLPEKTQEEFTPEGFFKTGDVGLVDSDGYVHIVGRNKDLIISGGYNIYPAEVEAEINAVAGVAESAVVGVPHPDFGEVGVAIVIPLAGVEVQSQVILLSLKQRLAHFKIPKACVVVGELPRNAMGKVQKNKLRETYQDWFLQGNHKGPSHQIDR